VQTPKPFPVSFATEPYFGVSALEFTNASGDVQFGRYRIVPEAGVQHLDDEALKAKGADYSFEEIQERVAGGAVKFQVVVQLAEPGDVVDDATIHWPEDRKLLPLGTLEITALVRDDAEEQRKIIFDPIPRCEGIAPSDDPLLELRAAIYLISGRRRRSAA
jgi:catalase